jgi:hypothetical protein
MMTPADWMSLMAICGANSDYLKACEILEAKGMIIKRGRTGTSSIRWSQSGTLCWIRSCACPTATA